MFAQAAPLTYYSVGAHLQEDALAERIAARVLEKLAGPSQATTQAVPPTLVQQKCGKCHGGADPKGGLSLLDLSVLSCEVRLEAVQRIVTDDEAKRMPKGGTLTPEEAGLLLQELSR